MGRQDSAEVAREIVEDLTAALAEFEAVAAALGLAEAGRPPESAPCGTRRHQRPNIAAAWKQRSSLWLGADRGPHEFAPVPGRQHAPGLSHCLHD